MRGFRTIDYNSNIDFKFEPYEAQSYQPAKYHRRDVEVYHKDSLKIILDRHNVFTAHAVKGMTFRQMETVLGIPKSTCHRLFWNLIRASIDADNGNINAKMRKQASAQKAYVNYVKRLAKIRKNEVSVNRGPKGEIVISYTRYRNRTPQNQPTQPEPAQHRPPPHRNP